MRRILVQEADFDAGTELVLLSNMDTGGIASFIGVVRASGDDAGRITALTLQHYPGMAEKSIERIVAGAEGRWPLTGCTVIHRVGRLLAGEQIVFVGAASPNRKAALQATAFLIDWLKTRAPFWKAEEYTSGQTKWVDARAGDAVAADAWDKTS